MIKSHEYSQGQTDHMLFVKHSSDRKITILIVYVDDIILIGDNFEEMEEIKRLMAIEFEVKDLRTLKFFWEWKSQEVRGAFLYHKGSTH